MEADQRRGQKWLVQPILPEARARDKRGDGGAPAAPKKKARGQRPRASWLSDVRD
jgi:hypothetical protein